MINELPHLQQMTQNCSRSAKVIAITSGKGGVGKTNIAANLAICLAASQKKVLLLDADMSLGNLDVIMNINSRYNVSHLLAGRKSIQDIVQVGPKGLKIICGASGLQRLANIDERHRLLLLRELSKLQQDTDVILIDTAAGISRSVVGFCLAVDHVLVVTTPEPTAMTDAYGMTKVLLRNRFAGHISFIVNMADTTLQGIKTYKKIAKTAEQFLAAQTNCAGILLKDERLQKAVRSRMPVVLAYPKSRISLSLIALAAKLGNGLAAQQTNGNFFEKFLRRFF
jgi:flagellar biosynthesis protein FlhG